MLPKRCGGIFAGLVMLCRVSISCYTVLAIGAGEQFSRVCLAHTAPGFCVAVKLSRTTKHGAGANVLRGSISQAKIPTGSGTGMPCSLRA